MPPSRWNGRDGKTTLLDLATEQPPSTRNTMKTPTPRTDAEAIGSCGIHSPEMVRSVFARQLETELNELKESHAKLVKAHKDLLDHHYWPEYTAKAMADLGLDTIEPTP